MNVNVKETSEVVVVRCKTQIEKYKNYLDTGGACSLALIVGDVQRVHS